MIESANGVGAGQSNQSEVDIIGQADLTTNNNDSMPDWLQLSRQMFHDSTTYVDTSIRPVWDRSTAVFNSEHPTGSRFASSEFAHRSKIFHPKIKPAVRRQTSIMAAALFTNADCVSIEPEDKGDKDAEAAAIMFTSLLQNRLDNDVNWFLTTLGAYQDALIYSICTSKQYWAFDPQSNLDRPVVELVRPENFRFDPNCDSRDPTSTSPYLIEIIPLYAGDVLERMRNVGDWFEYSLAEIISSTAEHQYDSTRSSREGSQRVDPTRITQGNEYSTVFVHFNILKYKGVDVAFYTLGVSKLLSEPTLLTDLYKHGRDLYRIGFATYESHKNYPKSMVDDVIPLQEEINRHVNNRFDNVNQVLNKRFFVKRQGNVDLKALMRNVPGGGVMVDNVDDVKWMDTPDISRSAYEEQDRLNLEFDDVMCITNQATTNSNRKLHETLGGMELMESGANNDQELLLLTFIYSWVTPVLRTLLRLIQDYETDHNALNKAADKAGMDGFKNADPATQDKVMGTKVNLKVNVGFGNTNPDNKVKKLMLPLNAAANMPGVAQKVDWDEVVKELFSNAGYGDGSRFLLSPEQQQQAQQQQQPQDPDAQAKAAQLDHDKQKADAEMQLAQTKLQAELQLEQLKLQSMQQLTEMKIQHEREMMMLKLQLEKQQKDTEMANNNNLEAARLKTERDKTAVVEQNKLNEMTLKHQMGSGI